MRDAGKEGDRERPVLHPPGRRGSCALDQHSRRQGARLGQDNQSSSLNQEERTPAPSKGAVTYMAKGGKKSESMQNTTDFLHQLFILILRTRRNVCCGVRGLGSNPSSDVRKWWHCGRRKDEKCVSLHYLYSSS